jgi:hypothetical protein
MVANRWLYSHSPSWIKCEINILIHVQLNACYVMKSISMFEQSR